MEFMSVDVDFCGFSFFFFLHEEGCGVYGSCECVHVCPVTVVTFVVQSISPHCIALDSILVPSHFPLSARNDVIVQWWSTNQTLAFSLQRAELGLFLWLLYFVAPTSCVCAAVPGEQLDGLRPDPQVFIQGPGALFLLGALAEHQLLLLLHKTIIKSE